MARNLPYSFDVDATYYFAQYPDVAASGEAAARHYHFSGWFEGRNPDDFFDTRGYLASNPDVAAAGIDPLAHFHRSGWMEGRMSSPAFDAQAYLAANPDVAAAGVDPLAHYLSHGRYEGRVAIAKPLYDVDGTDNAVNDHAAAGTATGVTFSWGGFVSPNLTYTIVGDTSGGGFAVDAATGQVTVADPSKIDYNSSGPSHSYTVTVQASDLGHSVAQSATILVGGPSNVATSSDAPSNSAPSGDAPSNSTPPNDGHGSDGHNDGGHVNNFAPVFDSGPVSQTDENISTDTIVYKAHASDLDTTAPENTVHYGFGEGGPDNALFTIDPTTGNVTFKASPDYEHPADSGGDNVYNIVVTATDDGSPAKSATQSVAITVHDVNESPPPADHIPTANNDSYTMITNGDQAFTVDAEHGVLANDSSTTLKAHLVGTPPVELNEDGSFTYYPDQGYYGTVTFQYTADDGTGSSAPATVSITFKPPEGVGLNLVGTHANEPLEGGTGADVFNFKCGEHIATGNGGADQFVFTGFYAKGQQSVEITDYASGNLLDVSAVTKALGASDDGASLYHVQETADGTGALLQVNNGSSDAPHWVDVAKLDGIHAGDVVDLATNPADHAALAHLHVEAHAVGV